MEKSIAILLLHYVHLSSKPDTSALKQVLRSCHGYKVTLWAWPCVELFYSPLSRWKSTWPNCQSQAFITSKPGWIHRSAKTFIRWQCGAFLKPCWHSQFASQTLATRMLHFENRCSVISLLGWNTWSYYTEKWHSFSIVSLLNSNWTDAQRQAAMPFVCIHSCGAQTDLLTWTQRCRIVTGHLLVVGHISACSMTLIYRVCFDETHNLFTVVSFLPPGHGFKFGPIVGKLLCELSLGELPSYDLAPFRIRRFQTKPKSAL